MATIERRVSASGSVSYRARVRRTGEPQVTKTFKRKTDAEAWARAIEARADRGYALPTRETLTRTLGDAIDRWVAKRLPEMAASDRGNVGAMAAWWKAHVGHVALTRLDPDLIEKYRDALRDEKDADGRPVRSEARVNRYLSTLSRVLGYAVKVRWLETNPVKSVERFTEPPGRVRWLTDAEVATLLAAVDARGKADFSLFVRFALFTGARRGEIEKLAWADLDLAHERVTFRRTKTGDDRTVPMPAVLVEAVKAFGKVRPLDPSAPLFPHSYRYDWREVQGILPDFRFHDARHTVASHLAMAGGSLLDIAAVTGHRTLAMVKRYSHLSDEHVRGKLEEAAARIGGKAPK